ncbi:MAG: calycin-like domain-containing protein [Bacteroidales bacterium]|nr:calycin-like domain-containing protein [Bacteroidales bacterium]
MKKALLLIAAAWSMSMAPLAAQNYDEKLVVTINGESTDSIPAAITVVEREDGLIDFTLTNFMLVTGEDAMPIGNIKLVGIEVTAHDSYKEIKTSQNIVIEPGDIPNMPAESWLGQYLGEVPIALEGILTDTRLYATIDIDMMASLGQVIQVVVGNATNTGISQTVTTRPTQAQGVYTLQGIRVADQLSDALPKGLYIVNGKKILK